MPSSIQGRQTDTLFEIKIVVDYTMKAGNHKTFQKYERKKTKPESRQGCHWRVQGWGGGSGQKESTIHLIFLLFILIYLLFILPSQLQSQILVTAIIFLSA